MLATIILINAKINFHKHNIEDTKSQEITFLTGTFLSMVGITATFWHIIWIAGLIFLISSCIGCHIAITHSYRLDQLDKNTKPPQTSHPHSKQI